MEESFTVEERSVGGNEPQSLDNSVNDPLVESPSFPSVIVVPPEPDKNVSRYGRTRIPTVKGSAYGGR